MKNNVEELNIEKIGLSVYSVKALKDKGIDTVGNLINLSIEDLNKLLGTKSKTINHIVDIITSLGLNFNKVDTIKPKITLDSPIEDLYLPTGLHNLLLRNWIFNIKDLISLSYSDLSYIRGMGPAYIANIINKLKEHGFKFEDKNYIKNINLDSSIYALYIDFIIRITFAKNGIRTIHELIQLETKDLLEWFHPYYSKKIVDEIHSLGFYFRDERTLVIDEQSIKAASVKNENNDIKSRIDTKNKLLETYQKLILEKENLLKQEQELDVKIEKAIEQLNRLSGGKYVRVKK